jgi:cob(I)alamin adenosyltransferase
VVAIMSIRINKVYTKTGDRGETGLVGGVRVGKDALRIEAYGTVDELSSVLGLARTANREGGASEAGARLEALLERVQNELFNLGSELATPPGKLHPNQPVIQARHAERLEKDIDELNADLPELKSFILPGGGWASAYLHLARTVCRRAERLVVRLGREEAVGDEPVRYLNRLSDALFVWARWIASQRGEAEILWKPEST